MERRRRVSTLFLLGLAVAGGTVLLELERPSSPPPTDTSVQAQSEEHVAGANTQLATAVLATLEEKGRAPRTGYEREQFGAGWAEVDGCDMRNFILKRDLEPEVLAEDGCKVVSGTLNDPYTAKTIQFKRGPDTSALVQIEHVVALSDAWQKGAQGLPPETRAEFANDPLNLLAVDGPTNMKKGDSDAATWLPPNKAYRCRYVARQIAVKANYKLWVTPAEKTAMGKVLDSCPGQVLPLVQ